MDDGDPLRVGQYRWSRTIIRRATPSLSLPAERLRITRASPKVVARRDVAAPGCSHSVKAVAKGPSEESFTQNESDRKTSVCQGSCRSGDQSARQAYPPASLCVVRALLSSRVLAAILPGRSSQAKLIPQGADLTGVYDSQIAFGQSQVPWV